MPARVHRGLAVVTVLAGAALAPASAGAAIEASIACAPSCSVAPGATVTFTPATSSTTTVTRYEWDLDSDGLFGTQDEPDDPDVVTAEPVRRTFGSPGSFVIGLRVTNLGREQATTTLTVIVAEPQAPPPPPPPPPPPAPPPPAGVPPTGGPVLLDGGADPLPAPGGSDLDRDGLALRRDACPGTPGGARRLWRGCAAVDLMRGARLRALPVVSGLTEAATLLRGYGPARAGIGRARALVGSAVKALEGGRPCPARLSYQRGLGQLDRAMAHVRAQLAVKRRRAARRLRAAPDVTAAAMKIALADLQHALAARALAAARATRGAFTAPCQALRRAFVVRGRVASTDDAAGLVRLAGGRLLVLSERARRRGPVAEGAIVRARGVGFKDGSGLAGELSAEAGSAPPGVVKAPCMQLRVAPVQPFTPWSAPGTQPTLHKPAAYRDGGGTHRLESGARLAVVQRPTCPNTAAGGKTLRYSARLTEVVGLVSADLAVDLEEGEAPVALGILAKVGSHGSIRITTSVQACKQLANGTDICDPPAELSKQLIGFIHTERGSLASAQYATTVFGIKDNDLTGDSELTHVTGLDLKGMAQGATEFRASGYVLENGASSRPETRLVELGENFQIFADDFTDDAPFALLALGVQQPSGLIWPRVVGTRNGETFWYSARLPKLVRDRLPGGICPELPAFTQPAGPGGFPPAAPFAVAAVKDSFYRLPFPKDFGPGTGFMNIDDPTPAGRHGESQVYGFDLTAPSGTPVLAGRGGTVVLMEDDDPLNSKDWPRGYPKIGNFVWLQHEDDTFAVYFHNKKDTALVALGDTRRRGAQLAQTGNTGQSSGPHVHFELFTMQGGQVVPATRARFEAFTGAEQTYDGCYIPRSGQPFSSTNGPLLGD